MRSDRIKGIELANGILLPLIFLQDLSLGLRASTDFFARYDLHVIGDGAIAGYCFLIGLSAGRPPASGEEHKDVIRYHYLRGLTILLAGAGVALVWPSGLLILFGVLTLAGTLLRKTPSPVLLLLGAVAFMFILFNAFQARPTVCVDPYFGGSIDDIVFNFWSRGYFGVLHWVLFMLLGLGYSRLKFLDRELGSLRSLLAAAVLFVTFIIEYLIEHFTTIGNPFVDRTLLGDTFVHLQPLTFILAAGALSLIGLHICINLNERFADNILFGLFRRYGRSRYTILLLQAMAGAVMFIFRGDDLFDFNLLIVLSLLLSAIFLFFVHLWSNSHDHGPVERALRTLTRKK